jgi:hypothetical protein
MKKLLVFVMTAVVLAACSNDNNTESQAPEDSETYQEEATDNQAALVQQSFPELFAYIDRQDSSFTPDQFSLNGENTIDSLPAAALEKDQLQPYKDMLVYSPDSTLAVDLFSYNYIITQRNGKSSMEEAGPDTEIGLVDVKNNTRKRIFFSGPATMVYDAKWINNKELMLAGSEAVENNQLKPMVWRINLADSSMQVFTYNKEVKADLKGYVTNKMNNKTAVLQHQ